jgi:hypothetical protein
VLVPELPVVGELLGDHCIHIDVLGDVVLCLAAYLKEPALWAATQMGG